MGFLLASLLTGGAALFWGTLVLFRMCFASTTTKLNLPQVIRGLPIIGNIHKFAFTSDRSPHPVLRKWVAEYGPIFAFKMGTQYQVLISSAELAKEVLVTQHDHLTKLDRPTPLNHFTNNGNSVGFADYDQQYLMLRRLLVNHLLQKSIQKANYRIRQVAVQNMVDSIFIDLSSTRANITTVDLRTHIQRSMLTYTMHQVFGHCPELLDVEELGVLNDMDIYRFLIHDPVMVVTNVDWRNLFPSLKWMPNWSLEKVLTETSHRKDLVVRALIKQKRELLVEQGTTKSFVDRLLTDEACQELTPIQFEGLVWEAIMSGTSTSVSITEWAMYELTKNPDIQDLLYEEIKKVAGNCMVSDADVKGMPTLAAIVLETERMYPAVALIASRYAHVPTKLGGYDIPKDWKITTYAYEVNMDPNLWRNPSIWDPSRERKHADLGTTKDLPILTFGAGRRLCPGLQQTQYTIPLSIAALVQHFDFTLPLGDRDDETLDNSVTFTGNKFQALRAVVKPRVFRRLPQQSRPSD